MGHRLQQFLPFSKISDLGESLRQIQVISADDAILDEPVKRQSHAAALLLRRGIGRVRIEEALQWARSKAFVQVKINWLQPRLSCLRKKG